jgi:hypothetical protein
MTNAVIGALRVNLGIDSAAFQNGLKNAQGSLSRFGTAVKAGLAAVAVAGVVALDRLAGAVRTTIDAADEMSKAAKKIGIPIEELSRLKYAADLSGVSFEGLQTSVVRLSKNMVDAANGTGQGAKAFAALGIDVKNADGSMKSASQVLAEISDKFAGMPDGAQKTAAAIALLGKAGADMIPLLNDGSAALNKLMTEADSFGQVFTAEMGANAEAFNDNMSRLQGVFAAVAAQVATALLPHLVQFSDWLVANGPQIAMVATALVDVAAAVIRLSADIVNLGVQLVTFVTGAWAQFEGAWDGLVATVNGMKDQVIASITAMTQQLVALLTSLKDQAIAVVSAMVTELTTWLTSKLTAAWDAVASKIEMVKGAFADLYDAVVGNSFIPDMVIEIGQWMSQLDANMVQPAADAAGKTAAAFQGVGDSIGSVFSGFGSSIAEAIKGTKKWDQAVSELLSKLGSSLFQSGMQSLFGGLGGGGGFGNFFSGLFGGLLGFANGGSFKVGGAGGIDSQVVAFRASPKETVDVRKPGQDREGGVTEVVVRGVFVDDNGVIKAQVVSMGEQAAQAGAAIATKNVKQQFPGMLANTQVRWG